MEQKHSNLGIASVGMNILVIIYVILILYLFSKVPGILNDRMSWLPICFTRSIPIFFMVALGLGIAGLMQKGRDKMYAVIGTASSAVLFLTTLFIFALMARG